MVLDSAYDRLPRGHGQPREGYGPSPPKTRLPERRETLVGRVPVPATPSGPRARIAPTPPDSRARRAAVRLGAPAVASRLGRVVAGVGAIADSWIGPSVVVVLALVIRLARLENLTLRIDEGYTLLYSRQSWSAVLGLDGYYDTHPPLYYVLVKLADLVVREEIAARAVAAVAGTLTVLVLYLIVARLLDRRAALGASLLLAVSPLHVEFSRDGRMYAPVVLVVAVSYLALVAFHQDAARRWAAAYGLSVLVAIYLDYSAAYALVPQIPLLVLVVARHRANAWPIVVACVGAVLGYLPWLPQLLGTIDHVDSSGEDSGRTDYLGASWSSIGGSIPAIAGFDGRASNRGLPNTWDRWSDYRPAMVLVLAAVVLIAVVALRRKGVALLVAASLGVGTVGVAIAVSLISPGYASRTLVPAALGLAIMAGAALARPGPDHPASRLTRAAGLLGWGVLVAASVVTLPATLSSSGRYDWREMSDDLASQAHHDTPIVVHSTAGIVTDVLDLYAGDRLDGSRVITITDGTRERWLAADRWLNRGPTIVEVQKGGLADYLRPGDPEFGAFWFLSQLSGQRVMAAFDDLGYERLMTVDYRGAKLSLFAKPGVYLGERLDVNGAFAGSRSAPRGWEVSESPVQFSRDGGGGRKLLLSGGQDDARITRVVEDASPGLYTFAGDVESDVRADLQVTCLSAAGDRLAESTAEGDSDGNSREGRLHVGVLCPEGTESVLLAAVRTGPGTAAFSDLELYVSPSGELDAATVG